MQVKAYVLNDGLYIPGVYTKGNKKEVLVNIEIIDDEMIKETKKAIIEHYEEEKKKEISINSEKVGKAAQKLGLKGITLEELINGNF